MSSGILYVRCSAATPVSVVIKRRCETLHATLRTFLTNHRLVSVQFMLYYHEYEEEEEEEEEEMCLFNIVCRYTNSTM